MKTFEITKEQILEVASLGNTQDLIKIKKWFPQAFEIELQYGRWLKDDSEPKWMLFQINKSQHYGFDANGNWLNTKIGYDGTKDNNNRYATDKEVETALIKEAKRRGFKEGVVFKSIDFDFNNVKIIDEFLKFDFSRNDLYLKVDAVAGKRYRSIFTNGKWAEIISEPIELTLEQIAEKFGTTADNIKIRK